MVSKKYLHSCASDESRLSIGRVKAISQNKLPLIIPRAVVGFTYLHLEYTLGLDTVKRYQYWYL